MTRLGARGTPLWAKLLLPLLILAVLLGGIWYWQQGAQTGPAGGGPYTLEVESGDTLADIAQELQDNGIVLSANALRYEMRRSGTDVSLQVGLYDLNGDMTVQEVAQLLSSPPRIPTVKVVIPEGKRIKDLPPIFAEKGFDAAALEAALQDPSYNEYAKYNMEGFVFPATYDFKEGISAEEAVQQMSDRMNQEFTPERIAAAKALGLSVYDWVTLASMVQAEAANEAEMPVIAGVFLNRLRDGMALGSDPTVAYGLGKNLPELDRSAGDFTTDHDWSTYTRKGLPKTPINNPGEAALTAVIEPERKTKDGRDALYFLHGTDGQIHVNHTYDEHLLDRDRYMNR